MHNQIIVCFLSVLGVLSIASAQGTTDWHQVSQVLPPEDGASAAMNHIGADISIFGDRLAATWRGTQPVDIAGFVYQFQTGTWIEESPLQIESGPIRFGTAGGTIAADGDLIAIGSATHNSNDGVVVVFEYDETSGQWTEDARLTANTPQERVAFGSAVAIQDNLLAVGAHSENTDGLYSGAVYVFTRTDEQWTLQQKLTDPAPLFVEQFGAAVAFAENRLFVGAPAHPTLVSQFGKVVAFNDADGTWRFDTTLTASDGYPGDRFGYSIAAQGDRIAVAAPRSEDENSINSGAVYIFHADSNGGFMQVDWLAPPILEHDVRSGRSIVIDDSKLLVGGRSFDPDGATFHYTQQDGIWTYQSQLCPINDGQTTSADFGSSLAVYGDQLLVGAPEFRRDDDGRGAIFVYTPQPIDDTDCNGNGVPDLCEPDDDCNNNGIADICDLANGFNDCDGDGVLDVCELADDADDCNDNGIPDLCDINQQVVDDCNANGIPDECEFAAGTVEDCNDNDIPDECETWDYALDRRFSNTLGWYYRLPYDAIWLNQFEVQPGAEWINSVSIFSYGPSFEIPFTIVIYGDPENDGDPNGSPLLRQVPASFPLNSTGWQRFDVPSTHVGAVGDSFFVGAITQGQQTIDFTVFNDRRLPLERRSWSGLVAEDGSIQLDPLGGFELVPLTVRDERQRSAVTVGSWLLRADGTHFEGVPNDCACPADIAAPLNETVDELDLMDLVNNWGDCAAPCAPFCDGDVSGPAGLPDCVVDVHDLLELLANWGTCPDGQQ